MDTTQCMNDKENFYIKRRKKANKRHSRVVSF